MLKEGQKFGEKERYQLVRQLGRGGFSEVWLADDTWTNIQVAIKVYAPGTGLDEDGIKIFTQEFSMVFDMNHTNLLKPTYFDNWERQPYLIMPLCKNGSAFKYVTGKQLISEEQAWNLLHDVAAGLAYLHGKTPPVIHQDIKPDNILISDEGRYMITDFGISARVRSTIRGAGAAQEQSGGTLAYMGPERFSATPKPIMASDVWSLGAMMYEILTAGTPPFGNHGGVLQKNGADIPLIEGGFSQELKDIVYACLAKNTWERPSASVLEEMAYNHLHGISVGTVPLTAGINDTLPLINGAEVRGAASSKPKPADEWTKAEAKSADEAMKAEAKPADERAKAEAKPTEAPGPGIEQRKEQKPQPSQKPQKPLKPLKSNRTQQTQQPYQPQSPQKPQQTQQPRPTPAAKPSVGISGKLDALPRNAKLGIGAGVAVLLLILGLVSFCGGDKEPAEETPLVEAVPQVNLDSIAQSKLLVADEYAKKAEEFQQKFSEELLNPENGKIEEQYMAIIDKCKEYAAEAAAAPGSTLTNTTLGERLNTLQTNAENQLTTIYGLLQEDIKALIGIGSQETADLYQERANTIRPYIEAKLPAEPVEQAEATEQTETQEQTEE